MRRTSEKLALVIPTLREAANLRVLLQAVCRALHSTALPFEILVVDDDSCDGTEELVREIGREEPGVRLLTRKGERGLSGAIVYGWRHTDATILGVMDADLQHPPELLPELVAQMHAGCDLVIGSRYARGGALGDWSPVRKAISAAAVWITLPLQKRRISVHDPMSGFFLVRRECVEQVMFQPTGFKLLLEVLVRGRVGSVREVPFRFGQRHQGKSKAGLRVAWDYLTLLCKLYGAPRPRMTVAGEGGD